MAPAAKLIYLGGHGRSGSTLLEYLLTGFPLLAACGEVAASLRRQTKKKKCTCGREVARCPIWGFLVRTPRIRKEGWDHSRLILTLLENASSSYRVVVDSSKTTWGSTTTPFRLSKRLRDRFQLVHIVRNPSAVCWSVIKKDTRQGRTSQNSCLRYISVTIGWWVANLSCEIFRYFYPERYLRIRYEDLVACPESHVRRILHTMLPREAAAPLVPLGSTDNRHQLQGNRMRKYDLSISDVQEDSIWRTEMPEGYQRLVRCLSWPLCRRYGYTKTS
jgi:hypothetical protein